MSKVQWSYSRLNKYRQCPLKSYWMDYAPYKQRIKEPPNPIFEKGNRWHKEMEEGIRDGKALSSEVANMKPIVEAVRQAPVVEVEHKMALDENRQLLPDFYDKRTWVRVIWDAMALNPSKTRGYVFDWKGLALDTAIPTANGWKTMQTLQEGDQVFDSHGQPCTVMAKSQIHYRPCYKMRLEGPVEIVCDNEHKWIEGRNREVLTTEELKDKWNGRKTDKTIPGAHIPTAGAMASESIELPIDPYVFGVWLGDGKHVSGEITNPDIEVWDEIKKAGYEVSTYTSAREGVCRAGTVLGIRGLLKKLGVKGNKHIPDQYMFADYATRLRLLQGLMDSDGNVNSCRDQCVFTTVDRRLSDQVFTLMCSLGQRPTQSYVDGHGFGKDVKVYLLSFRPRTGFNPFLLPRKADKVPAMWQDKNNCRRYVSDIVRVETVPTQCIMVDSPDSTYLCTKAFVPTHNTGKVRPDSDQLQLFAAAAFDTIPTLERVTSSFVFMEHNKFTCETYDRKQAPHIWQKFGEEVHEIEHSMETGEWAPRPGFHCKYCPVPKSHCPHSHKE